MVKKNFDGVNIIDSGKIVTDEFINLLETKLEFNKADKGSIKLITTQKDECFDQNVTNFFGDTEVVIEEETIN